MEESMDADTPRYVVRDKYHGDDDLPSKVDYKVSTLRWYIVDTTTGYLHTQDYATQAEAEAMAAKLNG
jgi:hypothetical protein